MFWSSPLKYNAVNIVESLYLFQNLLSKIHHYFSYHILAWICMARLERKMVAQVWGKIVKGISVCLSRTSQRLSGEQLCLGRRVLLLRSPRELCQRGGCATVLPTPLGSCFLKQGVYSRLASWRCHLQLANLIIGHWTPSVAWVLGPAGQGAGEPQVTSLWGKYH